MQIKFKKLVVKLLLKVNDLKNKKKNKSKSFFNDDLSALIQAAVFKNTNPAKMFCFKNENIFTQTIMWAIKFGLYHPQEVYTKSYVL